MLFNREAIPYGAVFLYTLFLSSTCFFPCYLVFKDTWKPFVLIQHLNWRWGFRKEVIREVIPLKCSKITCCCYSLKENGLLSASRYFGHHFARWREQTVLFFIKIFLHIERVNTALICVTMLALVWLCICFDKTFAPSWKVWPSTNCSRKT